MNNLIFSERKSCSSIGNPDFNLSKCRLCRYRAEPFYKRCLTIRIAGSNPKMPCQPKEPEKNDYLSIVPGNLTKAVQEKTESEKVKRHTPEGSPW